MKKSIILMMGVMLIVLFSTSAFSQSKTKTKAKNSFSEKLWYGGGFGLGLSNNSFGLELSPMIGYKLTDKFSVGTRIPLNYNYVKLTSTDGTRLNYNNLDWGLGAFSRYKLFRGIFAHAEYNYLLVKEPVTSNGSLLLDPNNTSKLLKESNNRDEFNIGLGYSSGNRIGMDFSLLYNVLNDANSTTIPWTIRVGVNYKF